MLHQGERPPQLTESELRAAIEDAIAGRKGVFIYDPDHIARHNVNTEDVLHICHTWTTRTVEWNANYFQWRYLIEGLNLNEKWMRVVIAVNTTPNDEVVAVTGHHYSRGHPRRKKKHELPPLQQDIKWGES